MRVPSRDGRVMTDPAGWPVERRQSVRVPLAAKACVDVGGQWLAGRLLNLSLGGGLFEGRGSSYVFRGPSRLRLEAHETEPEMVFPVSIVRVTRNRFALRWERGVEVDEIPRLRRLAKV